MQYVFRVMAEGPVGRSEPSSELLVTTEPQRPAGPPQHLTLQPISSTAIRVTWLPPMKELQHGRIQGYYVGYRESRYSMHMPLLLTEYLKFRLV